MVNESQKIENSMNLSFETTEEERIKSLNLNVGYDEKQNTWDAIVKFSGEPKDFLIDSADMSSIQVVNLLNEYAVITASEEDIRRLSQLPMVEYIEKPKRIFYERMTGKLVSGITSIQNAPLQLTGNGVIVGIVDSGIDYRNNEFRNKDGSTRILSLWDQTIAGSPPSEYIIGTEYTKKQIDEVLLSGQGNTIVYGEKISVASLDISGHGTEVASIAVGTNGVAPQADIIVVKLGIPRADGFPRTTELMQGIDYLVRKSLLYKKPLAINISFGNTYGAHDSSGLLERFIDDISNYWQVCICVGMGNEGNAAGHISGNVKQNIIEEIELAVDRREVALDLQIWKLYEDTVEIHITAPNGERMGPIREVMGTQRYIIGDTQVLLYYGEPSPHSILQEIYFEFISINTYIDSGIWRIIMTPIQIVTGRYDMWLPSYEILNAGTQFLRSVKENTLTIPSTAQRVISVGAYNADTITYADFSGRGENLNPQQVKPDIVAPGVNVSVSSVGGAGKIVSGTSFATPFVTGSAALLMEWGIVKGNDKYLFGEKMKAYLRKGAKPILGIEKYPDVRVGYGRVDINNII